MTRCAEIIAIGSELTSGEKLDTNSQWLSLQLAELGIPVHYHTTVADDFQANVDVLRIAVQRADLVLLTGGLGPTQDDLTREVMAQLAGVELVLDPESLEFIEGFFRNRGRSMPERNRVQAMIPAGCEPLPNPVGTAPGIWMEWAASASKGESPHRCLIAAMPGVPSEMYKMFHEQVRPRLPDTARVIRRARLHSFGLGESHIEQLLGELTARGRDPEIGITAHHAIITLRIIAHGDTEAECLSKIDDAKAQIRSRIGHYLFGEEEDEMEQVVLAELCLAGKTLATAESGTGGCLAQTLAAVDDHPSYLGGVVIPTDVGAAAIFGDSMPEEIDGEVAAAAMARECRSRFNSDYALAVAKFPQLDASRAMSDAPSGFFGLADADGVTTQEIKLGGNPAILRARTALAALNMLRLRVQTSH